MNRKTPKSRKVLTYLLISAVLVLGFAGISWYAYDKVSSDSPEVESGAVSVVEAPETLIGTWKQADSNTGDILAKARITAGSIQINLMTRDSTSIYWMGSFDTDTDPATLSEVTSLGDSDAMSASLFGSQDKTKKFSYEDGELTYEFTMMGTTSTVRLVKQ